MARISKKAIDKRIDMAYRKSCSGIQVDIMDISKIFAVGSVAIAEGANDEELGQKLLTFVNTIRKN